MGLILDRKLYDQGPYALLKTTTDPSFVAGPSLKNRVSHIFKKSQRVLNLIYVSQSNMTNAVATGAQYTGVYYTPVRRVYNFDPNTGALYGGQDPQFGCSAVISGTGRRTGGAFHGRLGDKLIDATAGDPRPLYAVINSPIGIGGVSIQNFAPPGTIQAVGPHASGFPRIVNLLARLEEVGMFPSRRGEEIGTMETMFIFNIGETDSGSTGWQPPLPADRWTQVFNNIVAATRALGVPSDVPWLITQTSYPFTASASIIRAAQAACVNPANNVFFYGDTDTLTGAEPAVGAMRQYDNIHFNPAGADALAEMGVPPIRALLNAA